MPGVQARAIDVGPLFQRVRDAAIVADVETGRIKLWNSAAEALFGYTASEAIGRSVEMLVPERLMAQHLAGFSKYRQTGHGFLVDSGTHREVAARCKTGEEITVELSLSPLEVPLGEGRCVLAVLHDVSERQRARQQAIVAQLGQEALAGTLLTTLLFEATAAIADTLGVEHCAVFELLRVGEALQLRAGVGWRDGIVGQVLVGAGTDSHAGYTLQSASPVIIQDLATETRFSVPTLLREHGVTSGLSCVIQGRERPFGVLAAHTNQRRTFTPDDVNFLQGVANVLATAIERSGTDEARIRLAAIVESSDDAIIGTNLDGLITTWNAGAARLFGYSADDVIGRPITLIYPPERLHEWPDFVYRLKRGERIDHHDTERVRKNGQRVDVALSVSPVKNAAGQIVGAAKIARDITDRKRAEHEQARLQREVAQAEVLRRADELKTALLRAVSHALRTPLTSIIASAGSLRQDDVAWHKRERQALIKTIETEAQRLNRLVGNLLNLSRIEAGQVGLDMGWHDTAALVNDVVSRYSRLAPEYRFAVHIDEDLPLVPMDYSQIDQVVSNLVENATKYAPPHTEIELRARLTEGWLEVMVADRGPGIQPSALPQLFEPFYRLSGTHSRADGIGLGLAVARGLVEAHGGRIWVESRPAGGARFVFSLPQQPPGRTGSQLGTAE